MRKTENRRFNGRFSSENMCYTTYMEMYTTGLFIGRFQPFHFGHLSAIKQGLEVVEKLVVVIGSADRNFSHDNPLTAPERLAVFKKTISHEGLGKRITLLTTLNDHPDNLYWVEMLIKKLPPFDVVVGNNNLVTVLTEYKGYAQFHPKLTKREKLQGVVIRNSILKKKPWKENVPAYILPLLEKFRFEERLLAL